MNVNVSNFRLIFIALLTAMVLITIRKYIVANFFLVSGVAKISSGENISNKNCQIMEQNNMFEFVKVETSPGSLIKYRITKKCDKDQNRILNYQDVISLLRSDVEFRHSFFDILRLGLNTPQEEDGGKIDPVPYFFEVCPVSWDTYSSTPFEFVLISAPTLKGITPDPR